MLLGLDSLLFSSVVRNVEPQTQRKGPILNRCVRRYRGFFIESPSTAYRTYFEFLLQEFSKLFNTRFAVIRYLIYPIQRRKALLPLNLYMFM